jgi:hypothetical protein
VLAALIGGVAQAFQSRVDGAVNDVVKSIRGSSSASFTASQRESESPMRAD